ncbi:MAG: hypothetical protein ABEJ46_03785, partial [Gemmatimonadota bacterium]
ERGDTEDARAAVEALESLRSSLRAGLDADAGVMVPTLRAAVAREEGRLAEALERARTAAERAERQPVPYGPPSTYKPPRELEGEILLAMERPQAAMAAFRQGLERTPRRPASLLGMARAARAAGEAERAATAYARLEAVWERAEEGWPGLDE